MNVTDKIAVCSRSFSQNKILRTELLERYQNVTFNDAGLKLQDDTLVDFIKGHQKAITALETIDEYILSRLPELQAIGKYGVGLDMIDMNAMRSHGIKLGWTAGVNKRSVSEMALAFMISMLRHIPAANREVMSGTWRQHSGGQLSGRTVGIIGCGNVGRDLVKILQPFECTVLVADIISQKEFCHTYGIKEVNIEELLATSDIVTLHIPLDDTTQNLLSPQRLSLMKNTAILINVARGGLVDETELKNMLRSGRIAAAAFDVFAMEPPADTELLSLPNFLATPHIGGSSAEAILSMGRAAIAGLDKNEIPQY